MYYGAMIADPVRIGACAREMNSGVPRERLSWRTFVAAGKVIPQFEKTRSHGKCPFALSTPTSKTRTAVYRAFLCGTCCAKYLPQLCKKCARHQ
jgi:hypothetical protein